MNLLHPSSSSLLYNITHSYSSITDEKQFSYEHNIGEFPIAIEFWDMVSKAVVISPKKEHKLKINYKFGGKKKKRACEMCN